MTGAVLLALGSAVYAVLVLGRCFGRRGDSRQDGPYRRLNAGKSQTTGTREFQADRAGVIESRAGALAVLADGIGRSNTGMVCAQIAVDTVLDQFEPYQGLNAPAYFFKTAFCEANRRIQQTIGERRGGAAMGAVFMDGCIMRWRAILRLPFCAGRNSFRLAGARHWMYWRFRLMRREKSQGRMQSLAWRRNGSGIIWDRTVSMRLSCATRRCS